MSRSAARAFVTRCCFVASLALGCGVEPNAISETRAPDAALADVESAPRTVVVALPAAGQVEVLPSERGFTVLANRAPPKRVLRAIERTANVHVAVGELPALPVVRTLRLEDWPLDRILAELLPGVAFSLHYGPPSEGEPSVLAGVSVGTLSGADPERQPRGEQARSSRRRRDDERGSRAPERTPEELARLREQTLTRLGDSDPYVRAREAAWIDSTSEEGLEWIRAILEDDPESEVRIAATEALSDSDSFAAVGLLLGTLEDSDPRVVIAALEALEFAGDETLIPRLEPVLDHPSPEVRERAAEAIEFLGP